MTAQVIDGTAIAQKVRGQVADAVARRLAAGLPRPGLATVLVGENPASQAYVKSKHKACGEAGITSFGHVLPATATQKDVETLVAQLNADPAVHGILVQLPMPEGLDEEKVLEPDQHQQRRRRLPPGEHRAARHEGPRPAVCALHARRLHRAARRERLPSSRAPTPWCWGARTLWACRSPCCCCAATAR